MYSSTINMQQHPRPSPASFLKHAADVATFYGFRPLREVERRVPNLERRAHSFAIASSACVQCHALHQGEPVLAYWASPSPMHLPAHKASAPSGSPRETGEFGLNIRSEERRGGKEGRSRWSPYH